MSDSKDGSMSVAALGALVRGDMENFKVASTPGGIEAQEAQGQRDLVASTRLPIEGHGDVWPLLFLRGVERLNDHDHLFCNVKLPDGWKLVPTEHSMWSSLVDADGTKVASIFYKAAFYDQRAFMAMA